MGLIIDRPHKQAALAWPYDTLDLWNENDWTSGSSNADMPSALQFIPIDCEL